ncbi:unnamed protein product [Arabidopsis halleri]
MPLFPYHGEGLAYMVACDTRNEGMVMITEDIRPSSPTTPCLFDFFSCQSGDLARVVPSAPRNERQERGIENVSTELTVPIDPDIWDIKKTLTNSDVGGQTRLLIPKESVNEHILKYFTEEEINLVEDEDNHGFTITVFDSEKGTTHELCFKRWNSAGSYVFE